MNNRLLKINLMVVLSLLLFASTIAVAASAPNLVGAFFVKGKVGLKWQPVDGATEYIVYRQLGDAAFAKIATTDKTNHFDTQLEAGAVYIYKIAAMVAGAEVDGTTKTVKLPAEIGGFSAPAGIEVRLNKRGNGISLRWNSQKAVIAYNVLRSSTTGSGYELVGNVSTNKYTDLENLVAGVTYYYVATAMNEEFEESANSSETKFKFGFTKEELAEIEAAASTIVLDSIDFEFVFEVAEANGDSLLNPSSIAMNSLGDIYFTDRYNRRVVCIDSNGKFKFQFGFAMENDERGNPPDGGFLSPFALAIGSDDIVYVSDPTINTIQAFTPQGKFIKQIKVLMNDGEAKLRANGLAIFDDGRILCSDVGNQRILILDNDGNILKEFKASEKLLVHFPNGVSFVDDNSFVYTNSVVGLIVTADLTTGEMISSFGKSGTDIGTFGRAAGVTISEDGLIWVTDVMGSVIQAFNKAGEVKIAITAGKFANENEEFVKPRSIIVKDGMFYIASEGTNKILAFKYKITKTEK